MKRDEHPKTLADDFDEMVDYLELDQIVTAKQQQPVLRKALSRRANAWLWALRVFAFVLTAMVIYTFVSQLHG